MLNIKGSTTITAAKVCSTMQVQQHYVMSTEHAYAR